MKLAGFFPLYALGLFLTSQLFADTVESDVCVYGGTSGGVIAAVQAARMGKTVTLVVVNNHLGGMTSGGLGQTDIGSFGTGYIQGTAREFYTRVGQKYGRGAKFTFEPHVAETVFSEMARQAGVKIYTNQYLASVTKNGRRIVAATMNSDNIFRAKVFIDASYEGDLMAAAGVSYTFGRESTNTYKESFNGIRPPNTGGHQFGALHINPYLATNNPAGELLPLIQSNAPGQPGTADQKIQAYNFRLCLTTVITNKLPIAAPANYHAAQYELLARYIQAIVAGGKVPKLGTFMNIYPMPNNKTDINNNGPVSTDFIGESTPYVQADYATRQQIWQAHKNYLQGFLYFLTTDSRVPFGVRTSMSNYGFCRDEFADNGGWPYQLYVREARRMISDYVMTQSNCLGNSVAPDSIGLGAYAMDSHNCQRAAVDGFVQNEGDTYNLTNLPGVYPISYRSIVPKSEECVNLLVPWCLSASHIAFGSIRMEPVFMILGQSAGTAAALAVDEKVPVQKLDYSKLRARLLVDRQILE
jgi:FAD dependent oxidoreductase